MAMTIWVAVSLRPSDSRAVPVRKSMLATSTPSMRSTSKSGPSSGVGSSPVLSASFDRGGLSYGSRSSRSTNSIWPLNSRALSACATLTPATDAPTMRTSASYPVPGGPERSCSVFMDT